MAESAPVIMSPYGFVIMSPPDKNQSLVLSN